MRRLQAAVPAAAFFVGLTLLCVCAVELLRWPWVISRLYRSDFEDVLAGGWPQLPSEPPVYAAALTVIALVGFAGLILTSGNQKTLGGTFVLVGVLGAWGLLGLVPFASFQQLRALSGVVSLITATVFALGGMLIIATAVLQADEDTRTPALVAAGLSAAMVAVTVHYAGTARAATEQAFRPWGPDEVGMELPSRPLALSAVLLAGGLLLSVARPAIVRRVTASLVLLGGLALSVPAFAVAHDEHLERHPFVLISLSTAITTVPSVTCPPPREAPVISVTPTEVALGGNVAGKPGSPEVEAVLVEALTVMRRQFEDLHAQAGEPDAFTGDVSLYADISTPMVTVAAIGRACLRAGYKSLALISVAPQGPMPVWTRPMLQHLPHVCALQVELTEGGRPLGDFADLPALVRAADDARGKLRVSVP